MLVWLALIACAPECEPRPVASLSIEVVDDPEPDTLQAAASALTEFRTWYPHDEICVASIEVARLDPDYAGTYNTRTGRLHLAPDLDADDIGEVVRHELCHAADNTWGIVDSNPNFWLETEVSDAYRRAQVPEEQFADACELGPRDHHRWRLTEEVCGVQYTTRSLTGLDVIREQVYTRAPRMPWGSPSREVVALPTIQDVSPSAAYAAVGATIVEVDGDVVKWRDPTTWAIERTLAVKGLSYPYIAAGDTGPYLRSAGADTWYAITPDHLEALPGCGDVYYGVVVDGVVWNADLDRDTATLYGCDLHSGEAVPLIHAPAPPFPLDTSEGTVDEVEPILIGASVGLWYPGAGLMWQTEEGAWASIELPWYFMVAGVTPTLDGTGDVLLQIEGISFDERLSIAFAWVDVSEGTTETAALPCLTSGAIATSPRVSSGDGWFLLHDLVEDELLPFGWSHLTPSG
jgi:hypothetical protein